MKPLFEPVEGAHVASLPWRAEGVLCVLCPVSWLLSSRRGGRGRHEEERRCWKWKTVFLMFFLSWWSFKLHWRNVLEFYCCSPSCVCLPEKVAVRQSSRQEVTRRPLDEMNMSEYEMLCDLWSPRCRMNCRWHSEEPPLLIGAKYENGKKWHNEMTCQAHTHSHSRTQRSRSTFLHHGLVQGCQTHFRSGATHPSVGRTNKILP